MGTVTLGVAQFGEFRGRGPSNALPSASWHGMWYVIEAPSGSGERVTPGEYSREAFLEEGQRYERKHASGSRLDRRDNRVGALAPCWHRAGTEKPHSM